MSFISIAFLTKTVVCIVNSCWHGLLPDVSKNKVYMKKEVGILLMAFSVFFTCSYGQKPAVVTSSKPGWHKIGETVASFRGQNESIAVLGSDQFSAIKIKVTEAPVAIERLQVFYEEGGMEEITVDNELKAGGETKVINLKNAGKDIQKVAFTYKTLSNTNAKKAHVELYGLKSSTDNEAAYRKEKKINDAKEDVADEAGERADRAEAETEELGNEIKEESSETGKETETKAEKVGKDIKRTAKKVGDGVAEGAGDVAANIKDKRVKGKVSPDGEAVYMDSNSQYYYINDQGAKVFISETQLRDEQPE